MGNSHLPSNVGHPLQDDIVILCIQLLLIFSLDSVHLLPGHQLQTVFLFFIRCLTPAVNWDTLPR